MYIRIFTKVWIFSKVSKNLDITKFWLLLRTRSKVSIHKNLILKECWNCSFPFNLSILFPGLFYFRELSRIFSTIYFVICVFIFFLILCSDFCLGNIELITQTLLTTIKLWWFITASEGNLFHYLGENLIEICWIGTMWQSLLYWPQQPNPSFD